MKTPILAIVLLLAAGMIARGLENTGGAPEGRQPLHIVQSSSIIYPYVLLNDGIVSGEAHVAIAVDPTGRISDLLVVVYSHRAFADAAVRAIREWTYEPARLNGEPVACRALVKVNFEAKGVVISINPGSDLSTYLLSFRRDRNYEPCRMEELDAIPTPLEIIAPAYPLELQQHGVDGEAVIDFYIDESGAVRLPAVVRADFWELGALAVNAVEQWKFDPPTRHGTPVLVHVEQRFVFHETKS